MPPAKLTDLLPRSLYSHLYRLRIRLAIAALFGEEAVRQRARRLATLKGTYRGRRGFIMGNGPSLNKMDLDLLTNEYVWGSNRCYLLFERIRWRPGFYVAVDKRVVPDNRQQINRLPLELPGTNFFYPVEFRARGLLDSFPNVYWYDELPVRVDMERLPEGTFTRDASKGVYAAFTVTVAALQLAAYLGFNPIYLIGCDTAYSKPASVRVEAGNAEKLVASQDDDPNHFDARYFGQGKKFHEPHVARMIFHYHEARLVCESLGVEVYNATVGGNLEEFPRVGYGELFGPSRAIG